VSLEVDYSSCHKVNSNFTVVFDLHDLWNQLPSTSAASCISLQQLSSQSTYAAVEGIIQRTICYFGDRLEK